VVFLADDPAPGQKRGKETEYSLNSKMPVNFASLPEQIYWIHFNDRVGESHGTSSWLRMIDNALYGQAQVEVTNAEFDFINGVFAFNVAKLSLARAMGRAADAFLDSLRLP
jgi:hypothetical protein